ncbi:MAG: hypothetical protein EXX96DRAFT_649672 [Benjaminiella poitrasii]|nr:MAG: hypothetical protein EXX96DRAFT_649672 [Benjaminiella poitrasii]
MGNRIKEFFLRDEEDFRLEFFALSKIAGFVEFKYKYLDLIEFDYSNITLKYSDTLGCFKMFNNTEIIIVEASSGKLQENVVHTIEDCL